MLFFKLTIKQKCYLQMIKHMIVICISMKMHGKCFLVTMQIVPSR